MCIWQFKSNKTWKRTLFRTHVVWQLLSVCVLQMCALRKLYSQGLKLTFCHNCQWPVTWSNLPAKFFFFPAMKLFLQKQAVITTTMTKHIYNVFNLSFTLLPRKKQIYWFIFLLFVPKNFEILVLYMFSANGAGHRVTPVSQLQCVCGVYFFCTHVNRLEQGYSISFIWGLDYQTEHLKGANGVGAVLISFWGTYKIRN